MYILSNKQAEVKIKISFNGNNKKYEMSINLEERMHSKIYKTLPREIQQDLGIWRLIPCS